MQRNQLHQAPIKRIQETVTQIAIKPVLHTNQNPNHTHTCSDYDLHTESSQNGGTKYIPDSYIIVTKIMCRSLCFGKTFTH